MFLSAFDFIFPMKIVSKFSLNGLLTISLKAHVNGKFLSTPGIRRNDTLSFHIHGGYIFIYLFILPNYFLKTHIRMIYFTTFI